MLLVSGLKIVLMVLQAPYLSYYWSGSVMVIFACVWFSLPGALWWPFTIASWASLVAQMVKNLPAVQETWVQSLDWEGLLEKGIQSYSLQGQRSLVGYRSWDHEELDTIGWLALSRDVVPGVQLGILQWPREMEVAGRGGGGGGGQHYGREAQV